MERTRIWSGAKLAAATVLLGVSLTGAFPAYASAGAAGDAKKDVCAGVNLSGGNCTGGGAEITNVIKVAVNILSVIAGVAATIMIVIAGLRYIGSGGESSKIAGAKSAITYAVIGLVIVALAQFIVRFVLERTAK